MDSFIQSTQILSKLASSGESSLVHAALRNTSTLRRAGDGVLLRIVNVYDSTAPLAKYFDSMQEDHPEAEETEVPYSVEGDIFIRFLVLLYLYDKKSDEAPEYSNSLVNKIHAYNNRTLDALYARTLHYFSLLHPHDTSTLLKAYKTASLRNDGDTIAMALTLLLKAYLLSADYSSADSLLARTSFPKSAETGTVVCRYQYFVGRIRAVQLDYSTASTHLQVAIRKAPITKNAVGFLTSALKLSIIVTLLLGEIPERNLFKSFGAGVERSLLPYLDIVRAVRVGDLAIFSQALEKHTSIFEKDGNLSLIIRLRQNVIKTGIRMMSISYTKISLRDICEKLGLDSEESAEYIVAKSIRDRVIDATLHHTKDGKVYMQSSEITNIYATDEPAQAFNDRIKFCLNLHDESVRSMRYRNTQSKELKSAEEARERAREIARELELEDGDESAGGGDLL